VVGYVEATIIPEGARNIRVEEVAEANNYLAIRNDKGTYYLNGDWYIQWSGDYEVAGTVLEYRREGNKESIFTIGPIKEPLHLMVGHLPSYLISKLSQFSNQSMMSQTAVGTLRTSEL